MNVPRDVSPGELEAQRHQFRCQPEPTDADLWAAAHLAREISTLETVLREHESEIPPKDAAAVRRWIEACASYLLMLHVGAIRVGEIPESGDLLNTWVYYTEPVA
jgi:glutathione S-transferase